MLRFVRGRHAAAFPGYRSGSMAVLPAPANDLPVPGAMEVGFESQSAFSRAFARVVGEPPGRYRQRTAQDRRTAP